MAMKIARQVSFVGIVSLGSVFIYGVYTLFTIDYSQEASIYSDVCNAAFWLLLVVPPLCNDIVWRNRMCRGKYNHLHYWKSSKIMLIYIGFGLNGYIAALVIYRLLKHNSQDLKYSEIFFSSCALLSASILLGYYVMMTSERLQKKFQFFYEHPGNLLANALMYISISGVVDDSWWVISCLLALLYFGIFVDSYRTHKRMLRESRSFHKRILRESRWGVSILS